MPAIDALEVNGKRMKVEVDGDRSLLGVLRDVLDLTGAKYGCGEGRCGACTVLVDGAPVRSCVTRVGDVASKAITTIEGLERGGSLHPLQRAFLETGAMQCGYCTCGMILSGVALLNRKPDPSREEIVDAMNGNMCRCGTYPRVIEAIRLAARSLKGGSR